MICPAKGLVTFILAICVLTGRLEAQDPAAAGPGRPPGQRGQVSTHEAFDLRIQNEILLPADAEKLTDEIRLLLGTWSATYGLDLGTQITMKLQPAQGNINIMCVESPDVLAVRIGDNRILTPMTVKNTTLMRTVFYPVVAYSILRSLSTPVGSEPGFIHGLANSITDEVIRRASRSNTNLTPVRSTPTGLQVMKMMDKAVASFGMETVGFVLATTLATRPAGYELASELRDGFVAASDEETVASFFPEALTRAAGGLREDPHPLTVDGLPPAARISRLRILGDIPLIEHAGSALTGPQRGQLFDATWHTLLTSYPDPGLRGVDWSAVYADLRSQVAFCRDDNEFYLVTRQMVSCLQDANTRFMSPEAAPVFHFPKGIETDLIGGVPVVTRVSDQRSGPAAKVQRGMILESVNGVPAAERIERIVDYERAFYGLPNERTRRARAGNIVLAGCPGTTSHLVFKGDETIEIDIPLESYDPGPPKPTVESRFIEDQYGYIRLRAFDQPAAQGFDDAINTMKDVKGLILDLRTSMGGNPSLAAQCMSRLLENPTTVGHWKMREGQNQPPTPMHVAPRVPVYGGPVVLIVDGYCFGTAEICAWALDTLDRVTLVGQQTAGNTYSPRPFPNNIGTARLMMGRLEFLPGETLEGVKSIEGTGLPVDIEVEPTIDDIRAGRDPELERAVAFMKEKG